MDIKNAYFQMLQLLPLVVTFWHLYFYLHFCKTMMDISYNSVNKLTQVQYEFSKLTEYSEKYGSTFRQGISTIYSYKA